MIAGRRRNRRGEHAIPALQQAIDAVFDARIGDISGRGKLAADMREIWLMQPRFERRSGSTPYALVEQPRFRAGYDFLRLRADAGEIDDELADWWEDFSLGSGEEREALIAAAREAQRGQPREPAERRQVRMPREARDADDRHDDIDTVPNGLNAVERTGGGDGAPAKKRRRRRRKPGAGGAARPAPGNSG